MFEPSPADVILLQSYVQEISLLKQNFSLICLYIPGDDWEHEEIFTDDDEAVGNDPEEREDLAPEIPAPPEIKQVLLFHSSVKNSDVLRWLFTMCPQIIISSVLCIKTQ